MSKRPKLTAKKLRDLIRDEKAGAKTYRKLGLNKLASDESRHRKFLTKRLKALKSPRKKRR